MKENVEHCGELMQLAEELGIGSRVAFLRSISDREKVPLLISVFTILIKTHCAQVWLLANCSILLYTPAGEHFGIVPLEAMYCGTPVLAVNSGGPLETVEHGVTGWLVDGQPNAWSEVKMYIHYQGGLTTIC